MHIEKILLPPFAPNPVFSIHGSIFPNVYKDISCFTWIIL